MRKYFTLLLISSLYISAGNLDFSRGVFIVNEDWYGHQNSTINYLDYQNDEGEQWLYRVIQTVNPGVELGCTNQYGQIYGDRFYLIAKQEKDPGASIEGGRITVADAKTMKVLFQSPLIDPSGASCDGRGYLGINEHKGYISSSNGIWVFDTDKYQVTGQVKGSGNSSGSLYLGQCGSMVRVNNRVFVAHQSAGVLVIDPDNDEVTEIISMSIINDDAGVGSVVLGGDGYVYVSVSADVNGTGATLPYLLKVNPANLSVRVIDVPDGYYPPANSWYAWTPDGFCSSTVENALYWNGGYNSWFSGSMIFKYNLDNGEFSKIIDLDDEAEEQGVDDNSKWQIYGCSMRPHPVTGEMFVSLFHNFQTPTYILRRYDKDGKILAEYDMITNYWFPSVPVFPDNEYPEVSDLGVQRVSGSSESEILLHGWATDKDNLDSAIIKSVIGVSSDDFTAEIVNGNLVVAPIESVVGDREVYLSVNSNGHVVDATIKLAFEDASSESIEMSRNKHISVGHEVINVIGHASEECRIYSLCGDVVYKVLIYSNEEIVAPQLLPGAYIVVVGNDRAKVIVN